MGMLAALEFWVQEAIAYVQLKPSEVRRVAATGIPPLSVVLLKSMLAGKGVRF